MEFPLVLGTLSFFMAVIWGQPLITLLKHYRIGKQVRMEGPDSHQEKTGTPTMGGLLFVVPVLLITGALNLANLLGLYSDRQEYTVALFLSGGARDARRRR